MHRWARLLSLNRFHFKVDRASVDEEDIGLFNIIFGALLCWTCKSFINDILFLSPHITSPQLNKGRTRQQKCVSRESVGKQIFDSPKQTQSLACFRNNILDMVAPRQIFIESHPKIFQRIHTSECLIIHFYGDAIN